MMKKKIVIIIFLILIFGIGIIILLPKEEMKEKEISKTKTSEYISIMLQNEEGNYEKSSDGFPSEGYHFNKNKSKCINGSEIAYENNEVVVKASGTDKCYAYFDNNKFVEDLSGNGNHGITYNIDNWNENGITFGNENHTLLSFIDCGLDNYDFGNTITLVVRLKFNYLDDKLEYYLIGNQEAGGIGILLTKDGFFDALGTTSTSGYYQIPIEHTYELNKFYTIIEKYDGKTLSFYINGELAASIEASGNIRKINLPILIGINPNRSTGPYTSKKGNKYNASGFALNAVFTDTLIFDRALSEEEIASDYADKINPTNKGDLLLWYKFDNN